MVRLSNFRAIISFKNIATKLGHKTRTSLNHHGIREDPFLKLSVLLLSQENRSKLLSGEGEQAEAALEGLSSSFSTSASISWRLKNQFQRIFQVADTVLDQEKPLAKPNT